MRFACLKGFFPRGAIDIGQHKNLACSKLLDNGRQQALSFFKIQLDHGLPNQKGILD